MKLPVIVLSVLFCGALLFAGCGRHNKSSELASPLPDAAGVWLKADPNPVPAGDGRGKTTITWNTNGNAGGAVYVTANGAEEKLFAHGSKGSADAAWIVTGHTYEFRLYSGKDHATLLAHITVTRPKS